MKLEAHWVYSPLIERNSGGLEEHIKRRLHSELFEEWLKKKGDYLLGKPTITRYDLGYQIRYTLSAELFELIEEKDEGADFYGFHGRSYP